MNREQAIERLKQHAFVYGENDPAGEAAAADGFLGMLRPFRGTLNEDHFHELMRILDMLADDLERESLDRSVVSAFWSLCQYARAWAIEPDGMLRSNGLISDEQLQRMAQWIDMLSYAVMVLLEGGGREDAFWTYNEYRNEQRRIADSHQA
ncbi:MULTISPECIES: hypothetical protein [Saccharibacillus]|uniref:hypothetical protein n=1 Tax=Saccharibacillus TaxID=456492 RepID=UPI00123AF682|nr:hypothetical protein [Saccharibacillus sp. WB 17]MWJ33389.1 hypothetical protein [Saccharibacillus sp. WB 17]